MSDATDLFDLEQFNVDTNELVYPDWDELNKLNAKDIYDAITSEYESIKLRVTSGEKLGVRARKISASKISRSLGKHDKYFTSREFERLHARMNELNQEIKAMYDGAEEPKPKPNRQDVISQLKWKIKQLEEMIQTKAVEAIVKSQIVNKENTDRADFLHAQKGVTEMSIKLTEALESLEVYRTRNEVLQKENNELKQQIRRIKNFRRV